jgi:hypothetical protein
MFVATLHQIISFGANLGFIGDQHPQSCKNLKSAAEHEVFVDSSIEVLTSSGHAAGPFPSPPLSNFRCSPLGVVGRKRNPNKLRVINHLSWPHNSSVNDGIPDSEACISYDMFERAVHDLIRSGRGSLMAKLDLKDAFRHIPVRAADWHLLGFHWGYKFFYLLVLAFGLKNAPYIFNLFAEALHWIIQRHIPAALRHYLDDFLLIFPTNTQNSLADAAVEWVMGLGKELGLNFQDTKTVWPCTRLEFLGLELDSTTMEARLPIDKLIWLQDLLHSWSAKRTCTLLELQELLGFLQFTSQVIPLSRSFLRRLFDFSSKFSSPFTRRHIPSSARADLRWWLAFSSTWNGVRLLSPSRPSVVVHTDASGRKGLGGIHANQWFASRAPRHYRNHDIQFKELYAIVQAVLRWGDMWGNHHVNFYCDNQAVVVWINSGTARPPDSMALIRLLSMLAACLNFSYSSIWIPSEENVLADAASRFQYSRLFQLAPHLPRKPCYPKSHLTGLKRMLTSHNKLQPSSGTALHPALANPTPQVSVPSLISPDFIQDCSTSLGNSYQQPLGSSLSGSQVSELVRFSPKQLNPTCPPFVPSMSMKVFHLMLVNPRQSAELSAESSVFMGKGIEIPSSPSHLEFSSNLQPFRATAQFATMPSSTLL